MTAYSGPKRALPAQCVHELIEARAMAKPDAVAAIHAHKALSYGELNARANQLATVLLSKGIGIEGVVGVVCDRNLDWLTAVLAIFKAGGAYLPIEPQLPADRMARMLSRAGCHLVLCERGRTTTLDQALATMPEVKTLFLEDALMPPSLDDSLRPPDHSSFPKASQHQLAYIYFTSGSTGEPKGAMCEHGGMLNHLFAKIDDLAISEGDVVAQVAPQGFDISMWQLVSALLVGGRTLIIEQEVILDAKRFIDTLIEGKVNILQVVPSYLEILVSYLAKEPHDLPDLRFVVATGEALKIELVKRWFALKPHIKLVNAYGLTETSDDTNHEIMSETPLTSSVPLGRPINNVTIAITDEHLSEVPPGVPGEIVFSGICVGRGYINDPERTKQAFIFDPNDPTRRLYRSGDFGRWLSDGKLEFLGRKDSQVKISGFRIEIGEIENQLLKRAGVREAAVVVAKGQGDTKQLVAFYTGEAIDSKVLHDHLAAALAPYMVPSVFHFRPSLPLTSNGKIDRKTLEALVSEPELKRPKEEAPKSETERRLQAAFAEVLSLSQDQISRQSHFFELGGTSLSAIQLVIALKRSVSIKDIARAPILADLAALIDSKEGVK